MTFAGLVVCQAQEAETGECVCLLCFFSLFEVAGPWLGGRAIRGRATICPSVTEEARVYPGFKSCCIYRHVAWALPRGGSSFALPEMVGVYVCVCVCVCVCVYVVSGRG